MNALFVCLFVCLLQAQREEAKKFTEIKWKLRKDIMELRSTVLGMVETNNQAPDIEKLERHEFNLDVEHRQRLVLEGEEKIKQVSETVICYQFVNTKMSYKP